MRQPVLALALSALLMGCTSQTAQAPNANGSQVTRNTTAEEQLVVAAGLTNVPSARVNQANAELGAVGGAGMAVTGALQGVGGLSNLASGGLGLLTFLTSPPAGPESWDHLIVRLPAGASPDAFAAQIQAVYLSPVRRQLLSQGYQEVPETQNPGQLMFAKPGCGKKRNGNYDFSCSYVLAVTLTSKGSLGADRVYLATFGESPDLVGFQQSGLNAQILKRAVDAYPGKVSLYVAPRRTDKGWTPAMLYDRGKPHLL